MAARVVHILGQTGGGGAENQALYLLEALKERGVEPELIFFREGLHHDRFAALGLTMHRIDPRRRLSLDWHRRAREVGNVLGARPPDILHTWLYETHMLGLFAARAWPQTRVVCAHRSAPELPGSEWHRMVLRPLRGRIDHVVANSRAGADEMLRFGLDADRVSVIGNGLPASRTTIEREPGAIRRELRIALDVPLICAVTRPDPTKDLPTLFAAFLALREVRPTAELVLVGPTARELENFGAPLPVGAHAIGFQPRPASYINAADVVAVSSRTEGHSNVAGEALLLGMPVASTATGAHIDLVRDAGGRVVPVEQPNLLAAAMLELLDAPPRREHVRGAVGPHLSIAQVADATVQLYERLLGDPFRSRAGSDQRSRSTSAAAAER